MKIRTQNLLTILPIFIGLGVILSFFKYTTERQELLWGMQEEISSLAVTISEFLTEDDIKKIFAGQDIVSVQKLKKWSMSKEGMEDNETRNRANYIINSLYLLVPNGRKLVNILHEKKPKQIQWREVDALSVSENTGSGADKLKKNMYISSVKYDDENNAYMSTFISLAKTTVYNGEKEFYLGLDTDVSYYDRHLATLFQNTVIFATLTGILGVLIALFLSRVLTKKIKRLNEAAEKVIMGQYNQPIETGSIQEVSDLGNTFNTMSSILQEILSKTQNDLVVAEKFLTEKDLSFKFQELTLKPIDLSIGGVEVKLRFLGNDSSGDFWGHSKVGVKNFIILGRVASEETYFQTSLSASGAFSIFEKSLASGNSLPDAISKVHEIIDIDTLYCLCFEKEGKEAKMNSIRIENGGKISDKNYSLSKNTIFPFHTLPAGMDSGVNVMVEAFSELSVSDAMSRIERNLDIKNNCGCLLLVKASQ